MFILQAQGDTVIDSINEPGSYLQIPKFTKPIVSD